MESRAIEISPNLYVKPPRFGQHFQEYYDEHQDHMPGYNLRENFETAEDIEE